jgi:hypothetical protein
LTPAMTAIPQFLLLHIVYLAETRNFSYQPS